MPWSPETIVKAVKVQIEKLGRVPASGEWDRLKLKPTRGVIRKHFGLGFNDFLKLLGYTPQHKSPVDYTDEELLSWLHRYYEEFGQAPTADGFRRNKHRGSPDPINYQRRFGSWEQALKVAGFDSNRQYSEEFLKAELLRFIKEHGRPPTQNELNYASGYPGKKAYVKRWGSVNNCLLEMGITPPACQIKNAFTTRVVADDGHICDSHEEAFVDNFLFANGIKHARNVRYPWHEKYNRSGLKRCDFAIPVGSEIVYVEYAGLIQKDHYRRKLETKIHLAEELGLKLIVITQAQLGQLRDLLDPVITEATVQSRMQRLAGSPA